ncbi:MAG TPA: DUF1501 domain-containing protein [Solimonas sp.]|nr:DUF1501 domain-containing protein [Solimonas sp.]
MRPQHSMSRRLFLRQALAAGALYGCGGLPGLASVARASFAPATQPILADLTLTGGPDFRHLLPPPYSSTPGSYGYEYWRARARSHGLGYVPAEWQARWADAYFPCEGSGQQFGMLRGASWLYDEWRAGHVAIISNAYGGTSRDHEHCTLVLDQGNLDSGPNHAGRSGWGGRLAEACDANVVALSRSPRPFCYASTDGNINLASDHNLINAGDTRNLSLFHPEVSESSRWSSRARTARALRSYYTGRSIDMLDVSPARRMIDLEQKVRVFGQAFDDRLATLPVPELLARQYSGDTPVLYNRDFGLQLRNLHDSLACNDLLSMRVASLEYGGWDTHSEQSANIDPRLRDLFMRDRGISALHQVLPADVRSRLVWVIAGEFGRQLSDNGDGGTDHGLGNCVLVIGESVRGGVYGNMFPQAEISRLQTDYSPHIDGLTAFDHVFGRVADYIQPGAGSVVFPKRASRPLEAGVNLSAMF